MRFGSIDFPAPLLKALREKRLVVFAGAGVSMGSPSNLPSFWALAEEIGSGRIENMPNEAILDRELGNLERAGVDVHKRCIDILQRGESHPTELHRSLLQLFGDVGDIRLVTTNYDPHFTSGALEIWSSAPEVFRAPALPLGTGFTGVVHVHGSLLDRAGIVLTDADFGRAYLTEGWARRFLLDVFRTYSVLFVGYRHEETVIQYMARALPPELTKDRYALVIEDEGTESWRSLGIAPIVYPVDKGDRFLELRRSLASLAAAENRGVLDLQRDLNEIASAGPPHDGVTEDQVKLALGDAATARFFTRAAKPAAWLEWLDARQLLDPLFKAAPLDDVSRELCTWAAKDAREESNALLGVLGKHMLQFSPELWMELVAVLGEPEGKFPTSSSFGRWLTVLLARPPASVHDFPMSRLASMAHRLGDFDGVLGIFRLLARSDLAVRTNEWVGFDASDKRRPLMLVPRISCSPHMLAKLWKDCIEPNLNASRDAALQACVDLLQARYDDRRRWATGAEFHDHDSGGRSAVEDHPQDRRMRELKPIIDGARRCVDHAVQQGDEGAFRNLRDRLFAMSSPLVRRIAIYATWAGLETADAKLRWLRVVDVQDQVFRHEVFTLLAKCYPLASAEARAETIAWVQSVEPPARIETERDYVRDSLQFNLLWWLDKHAPGCALVTAALTPLQVRHPKWKPSEHPDLLIFHSQLQWGERPSPVPIDELLSKQAGHWVDLLLSFEPEHPLGPTKDGLWDAVVEACKASEAWQRDLLAALEAHWDSPLWSKLIAGWNNWPESEASGLERLQWLMRPELQKHHASAATFVLRTLVRAPIRPYAAKLLPQADEVCRTLAAALEVRPAEEHEGGTGWLDAAINQPAGGLTDYVLDTIEVRSTGDAQAQVVDYGEVQALLDVLLALKNGHLAFVRPLLGCRLVYLLEVVPAWAKEFVVPWLTSEDDQIFEQVWNGFIFCGRVTPQVAEAAAPALQASSARVAKLLRGQLTDYMDHYLTAMLRFSDDPRIGWIPKLLQGADEEVRHVFASRLRWMLEEEPPQRVSVWWNTWLKAYWQARLDGVPAPLVGGEIAEMLAWLVILPGQFPQAVHLAARMPKPHIEYSSIMSDLVERGLPQSHPEETAAYLTAVLKSDAVAAIAWELQDVIPLLDRTKVSAATLAALDAQIALGGF